MKKLVRVISLLLCIALLLGCFASCGASREGDLVRLKKSFERALEKRCGSPVLGLIWRALSEGGLSLSVLENELFALPFDTLSLQTASSFSQGVISADADVTLNGRNYDLSLYANREELSLCSFILFGGGRYGIHLDTLEKDLLASPLYKESGSALALDFADEALCARIGRFSGGYFDMLALQEQIIPSLGRLVELFLAALGDCATVSVQKENGKRVVRVSVDNRVLASTLKQAYKALCADGALCETLLSVARASDAMHGTEGEGVEQAFSAFLQSEEGIDRLCDRVLEKEAFVLELEAVQKRLSGRLLSLAVSFAQEGRATISAGLDLFKKDRTRIELCTGAQEYALTVTREGGAFKRVLAFEGRVPMLLAEGARDLSGEIRTNVWKKQIAVALTCAENSYFVEGGFSFGARRFAFEIDSATHNGEKKAFALCFSADTRKKLPDAPAFQGILQADEAVLGPVLERARLVLPSFLADLVTEMNETPGLWELLQKIGNL